MHSESAPYAIAEISKLISRGSISARDLTRRSLELAERYSADGIFITDNAQAALEAAKAIDDRLSAGEKPRLLEGVPFVVKDNIEAAGLAFTGGSKALNFSVPSRDPHIVQALKEAGAILLGKVNLHEFAFGVTSNNAAHGPVRNPHDDCRTAGGSSGGSAAAVARGIATIALGTDTGGSGRIPASFCGCVGFRPSRPRYGTDGLLQLTWTLDTAALFGTSVSDILIADAVLTRRDASLHEIGGRDSKRLSRPITLGIPDETALAAMDHGVATTFSKRLDTLKAAGMQLKTFEFSAAVQLDQAAAFDVAMFEANALWSNLLNKLGQTPLSLVNGIKSPDVVDIFDALFDTPVSAEAYMKAMNRVYELRHHLDQAFVGLGLDALCFPTVPVPPPLLREADTIDINGVESPLFPSVVRHTSPGALAGLPGLSIPAGALPDGLPFGLEIDGLAGGDDELLALALELEFVMRDRT